MAVTPETIYKELTSLGASTAQALGIMANMMNESSFNPEEIGDQGTSFGLVQQHGNYSYLVTGNPEQDMARQLRLLVQNGGLGAASGGTPAEAAGNFAANYERCVGCQPGGAQFNQRVANAAQLVQALTTGKWPTSGGSGGGGGGGGGTGGGSGGGGGKTSGASGDLGLYATGISDYPGSIQTTSFFGDVFSIIEDPFKAITGAASSLSRLFLPDTFWFLDVFKTLVTYVGSLINGLDTIINDLLWLFNPTHWIRIAAFVFGLILLVPAAYAMMHTGTGDLYLAMGIFLVTLDGILFFLAFHNLPWKGPGEPASSTNVINFQSLLAWVSEGIRTGAAPAPVTVTAT